MQADLKANAKAGELLAPPPPVTGTFRERLTARLHRVAGPAFLWGMVGSIFGAVWTLPRATLNK